MVLTRQLSNLMIVVGLAISPDITKCLDYLKGAGYIEFTNLKVTACSAYAKDAVIRLTKASVDPTEGIIENAEVGV